MSEVFSKFRPEDVMGFLAIAGGLLCGMVAIVMGIWKDIRKAEIGAALKQDMLNRGMSADDIRTVLDAGSKASRKNCRHNQVSQA